MKLGLRVRTLKALDKAAKAKRAVVCPGVVYFSKHIPAAWMIHLQGAKLVELFKKGMYLVG